VYVDILLCAWWRKQRDLFKFRYLGPIPTSRVSMHVLCLAYLTSPPLQCDGVVQSWYFLHSECCW